MRSIRQGRAVSARPIRRHRSIVRALYVVPVLAASLLIALLAVRSLDLSQRQADAYAAGHHALAHGDLVAAVRHLTEAGTHADARDLLHAAQSELAPYALAYEEGSAAFAAGRYDEAVAKLQPVAVALPGYADVTLLLERARANLETAQLDAAMLAIESGDWLGAELILSRLAHLDPENADVAERLAALRGAHPVYLHTSSRALVVSSLSGGEPIVIDDSLPAAWPIWSPDRSRIAFVMPGSGSNGYVRALFVINADGSGLRQIAEGPARWRAPVWSPDGEHIAFEVDGPTAENLSGRPTVMVANVETGVVRDIVAGSLDNAGSPSWSPTGDRLAFVVRSRVTVSSDFAYAGRDPLNHGDEVFVKDMATGRIARISGRELLHPWRIAWSPGSEEIAVYSRADGTSYSQGTISLLNATTGMSRPIDVTSIDVSMPVWSPDGRFFAYVARNSILHVVEPDAESIEFAPGETMAEFITWSPDSNRLLVSGGGIAGSYLIDLSGDRPEATPVAVTFDAGGGDPGPPQWSPVHPGGRLVAPGSSGTALDRG